MATVSVAESFNGDGRQGGRKVAGDSGHGLFDKVEQMAQELAHLRRQLSTATSPQADTDPEQPAAKLGIDEECPGEPPFKPAQRSMIGSFPRLAWLSWRPPSICFAWLPKADLRALAFFRIFVSLLILIELARTYAHRDVWLLDTGISPRTRLVSTNTWADQFNIYLAAGSESALLIVVALHASLAVCLLLGYYTQRTTVLPFLVDCGFQFRTHCYQNSSGAVRRCLLFWSIFTPMGARFAVRPEWTGTLRAAAIVFAWQFVIIYYISALTKSGQEWHDGTALWHALHLRSVASRPLAPILTGFPWLCRLLTHATVYQEKYGCLLLFVADKARLLGIVMFVGLHIGIEFCMDTGQFQWAMCCGLAALMPTFACDYIEKYVKYFMSSYHAKKNDYQTDGKEPGSLREALVRVFSYTSEFLTRSFRAGSTSASEATSTFNGAGYSCMSLVCMYAVWVQNCQYVTGYVPNPAKSSIVCPATAAIVPQRLTSWLQFLGLYQEWRMFAPQPANPSVWVRMAGLQNNGVVVDLFHGGEPSLHLPPLWRANSLLVPPTVQWADQRWVKFLEFSGNPTSCNMLDLGSYMCRYYPSQNNKSTAGLHGLAIFRIMETVNAKDGVVGAPHFTVVHYQWCTDEGKDFVLDAAHPGDQNPERWYLKSMNRQAR